MNLTNPNGFTAIPKELQSLPRWVNWRTEMRGNRPTKVPMDPHNGRRASCSDRRTWASFEQALARFASGTVDGIGFELGAPYVGVDLDECRNPTTGAIEAWAQQIIGKLQSYTESSPSGKGVHILAKGILPPRGKRRGHVEMYGSARFLTVTGEHVDGTPTAIEERQAALNDLHAQIFGTRGASGATVNEAGRAAESLTDEQLIDRSHHAVNGTKFAQLWAGNYNEYASKSEADMALCMMLAFWTGRNPDRVDRLFRQSGLFRPKWDERHSADGRTYGQLTVDRAIEQTRDVWRPSAAAVSRGNGQRPDVWTPSEKNGGTVRAGSQQSKPTASATSVVFPRSAFVGLGGEFAKAYEPGVESPPEFLLTGYWTYFGAALSPYVDLDLAAPAEPRLYTVHLGESATPRKSSAQLYPAEIFSQFDWLRVHNGFGSAEGLARYIRGQGQTPVLLQLDELKLLVDKCQQQRGSIGLTLINTLYERTEFDNATVRLPVSLREAHLSMLAGCTVQTYADMFTPEFLAIGFPNRLFLVYGERKKKVALPRKPSEARLDKIRCRTRTIIELITQSAQSSGRKLLVPFDADAKRRFKEWYEALENSIHARRLEGLAHRIAVILALTSGLSTVTGRVLEIALAVADYELEVRKLYDPVDADGKVASMEMKIRRVLEVKGPIKERELRQVTHADRAGLWAFQSAIKNLTSAGDIKCDLEKRFHRL